MKRIARFLPGLLLLVFAAAKADPADDPFMEAPVPAPPKPKPRPEVVIAAPPPLPAPGERWTGTTGVWEMEATVQDRKLTGRIRCFRDGSWGGWGATFVSQMGADGTVSASTPEVPQGAFAAFPQKDAGNATTRTITGQFPHLNIGTPDAAGRLGCPNGPIDLTQADVR